MLLHKHTQPMKRLNVLRADMKIKLNTLGRLNLIFFIDKSSDRTS